MQFFTAPSKILIFHIGHLGDTLMIVPSIRALRKNYPKASFTLLSDKVLGDGYVLGASLFDGSNFFDECITFPKIRGPFKKIINPILALKSAYSLRSQKFNTVAYLVPSMRSPGQIKRDRLLFKLTGIQIFFGFLGFDAARQKAADPNKPWVHEADAIMKRLALDGLNMPTSDEVDIRIEPTKTDIKSANFFLNKQGNSHENRIMIGFGPGSKMQSKKWPHEKYLEVGKRLITDYDIWPIVFGGTEDKIVGDELLFGWGRGYNAAGKLGLHEAAAGLSKCVLYIGNDTGTMHLATSVSTPCIAIFSARDLKGKWYPYGKGHIVFRENIHCAGCQLETCEHKTCLMKITAMAVSKAAESRLEILTSQCTFKKKNCQARSQVTGYV